MIPLSSGRRGISPILRILTHSSLSLPPRLQLVLYIRSRDLAGLPPLVSTRGAFLQKILVSQCCQFVADPGARRLGSIGVC